MILSTLALIVALSQQPTEPPKDHVFRAGIVTLAAVSGADIATTAQAAERGGFKEANPVFRKLFREPAVLGLANGALSAGVGLMAYDLHRKGHRKAARWIVWGWAALRGYVVIRNVRTLQAQ